MTRPPLASLVLALAIGFGGNADARRRRPPAPPELVERAAQLGDTDRMAAIATLEDYLATSPDPEVAPWAKVWAGEQRRLAGDLDVARRWFEQAAADHPTHYVKDAALLGMTLIDADRGVSGNQIATLQLLERRYAPNTMNADRYRILARVSADEGAKPPEVREFVRQAVAYSTGDDVVEARVRATLDDLLTDEQTNGLAEPVDPTHAELEAVDRITAALESRRFLDASAQAALFQETWPDSEHAVRVKYMGKRATARDPVNAGKVAVLLPQTGNYAPVGQRLKEVIELANDREGHAMDFVWIDTGGKTPEQVVAAAEQAVLQGGVVAILGPLLKENVMPTAEAAQGMAVPMVALSQSASPPDAGDYIYRGFLPLEQQVDALLDHAMGGRGWQKFAILHPESSYGETTRDLFAAGVERRGGKITRVVQYDPAATDFLKPAQELGQKDYTERANEFYRLKKAATANNRDTDKLVLPPLVDFDAIFIPDNWRRVSLVASSLAYEEFPVGGFRPHRHAEPVPLLGLNGWNDERIVESGGTYVKNAIFVDAFLADSSDGAVRNFVQEHRSALGRAPGVIDAVTWDATRLLAGATMAGGTDRSAVRDELGNSTLATPVAGGDRFGDDREVARRLLVLTITKDDIVPWRPPEEELPPEGLP